MEVFEQYSLFCVPVGMDLLPPPPSFGVEVCMFVVPEMELWPPCLGVDIGVLPGPVVEVPPRSFVVVFFAGPVIENKCKCDFFYGLDFLFPYIQKLVAMYTMLQEQAETIYCLLQKNLYY